MTSWMWVLVNAQAQYKYGDNKYSKMSSHASRCHSGYKVDLRPDLSRVYNEQSWLCVDNRSQEYSTNY